MFWTQLMPTPELWHRFRSAIDKGLLVKVRPLGEGGFGSVFLCESTGTDIIFSCDRVHIAALVN